jgi:ribose transport system permease protein
MTATAPAAAAPASLPRRTWDATHRFRPVLLILAALFLLFSVTQDGFLTATNLRNLLTGVSILWVLALGMTFVLISAGVDLSAAAIVALAGVFLARTIDAGVAPGVAVVLTVLFGGLVGAGVNGFLIGRLGLSFFVVTLGSMTALTGVVSLWSQTETQFVPAQLLRDVGMGSILGIATPIWIMAATLAVALWVQHRTYLGRDVYAVGGSRVAARLAGIRTVRTTVIVYGISGLCAGIAALIAVGRIGAASPQVDNAIALQAAAAVLLGGTSLMGGAGGVGGTVFGVLFIGVLQNGLSIAGVQSFWQQVVTGVILVLAVLGDRIAAAGGAGPLVAAARARLSRRAAASSTSSANEGNRA